jgi:hypothetical protein
MWEWQPIETAPEDGTLVLVWGPQMGVACDGMSIAAWHDDERTIAEVGRPAWRAYVAGFRVYDDSNLDLSNQPTHWMPRPLPPS